MDLSRSNISQSPLSSLVAGQQADVNQKGCFLVNIGDMLSKWTDGIYQSTRHRVLHNSDKMRISVPIFFDPDWDAVISPVLPLYVEHREDEGGLYPEKFAKATMYSVVA
jgi:isopenicillin N synthase-like dioxygenase